MSQRKQGKTQAPAAAQAGISESTGRARASSLSECRGLMHNPLRAVVVGRDAECIPTRPWRCLIPLFVCAVCALQGCYDRPAPSPTPNPHPQHSLKLKIVVEKSEVNRVEVVSNWVVSNLNCAPLIYPAGNRRVKQVDVPEVVKKVDGYYVANVVIDRFAPDKCRWVNAGPVVNFLRGNYLLASYGVNSDVFYGKKTNKITCLTRPFSSAGVCGLRSEESLYKREDKDAFNADVELMQ